MRLTKADIEEVQAICASALESATVSGDLYKTGQEVVEARLTRSGLIMRGAIYADQRGMSMKSWICYGTARNTMREALENLGFLASRDFGRDGVIVTGWDPQHYEGEQLTSQRVRVRMRELQEVEQDLLELETSDVRVRDS